MKSLVVFALLVSLVDAAFGETAVTTGDRVRVTLMTISPTPIVGRVLELPPGEIHLAAEPDSTPKTISRAMIAQLEVQRGTRTNAARGALLGALIIGVPAVFLGYVSGATAHGEGSDATGGSGAVAIGAVGFVVGAGVGALVGSSEKHEKWEEVAP